MAQILAEWVHKHDGMHNATVYVGRLATQNYHYFCPAEGIKIYIYLCVYICKTVQMIKLYCLRI